MADTVKSFKIKKPNDSVRIMDNGTLKLKCRLEWASDMPGKRADGLSRAQKFVDQECIRRMERDTPFRSGVLRRSAAMGTVIGSGMIRQATPYARRQYYEHKEKSRWFERMKNRDKDVILEGARRIAAGN